jgi:hypothetical protein
MSQSKAMNPAVDVRRRRQSNSHAESARVHGSRLDADALGTASQQAGSLSQQVNPHRNSVERWAVDSNRIADPSGSGADRRCPR